jgi:hypothetical protein
MSSLTLKRFTDEGMFSDLNLKVLKSFFNCWLKSLEPYIIYFLRMSYLLNSYFKNTWMICVIFVMFLQVLVGLLNDVALTHQQQGNPTQSYANLREAHYSLEATSSGELVFAGGYDSTGPNDRVDRYCSILSMCFREST